MTADGNVTAAGMYTVQTHGIPSQLRHKAHSVQCMAFYPQRSRALSAVHSELSECAQPVSMHLQPCQYCIGMTCLIVAGVPSSNPEQPYTVQFTADCHLKLTENFQSHLNGGHFVVRSS